ncbi:metallophosphoesterase family protein [Cellulomonas sp. SG140]|uniref:metallophosphoesterase family protein n=1 Tax=Cellulomonas sp. SG140 TaxID=2976536 RepID=UPI0021E8BE52|nr:metallophosphoesterase family protein [Cellulomonas sp. SG140]
MSAGNIWLTSDLHLGHEKVATIRGFRSQLAHDDAIERMWWDTVKPKDQVWVLGDIAVSSPAYALNLLARVPGEKHLIWGNHDQGHPMHRDAHRKAARYLEVFASAQAFARRRIEGREVLLSHFPYVGDTPGRDGDRHTQYRLRDEGLPLIHGHVHDPRVFSVAPSRYPFSPQIHVGLDAWGLRLVNIDEVAEMLRLVS